MSKAQILANICGLLLDSSSSSDEEPIEILTGVLTKRVPHYYEEVVPQFSVDDFKSRFRLKRSTCSMILNKIADKVENVGKGRHSLPAEKQVLMVLWLLTTPESFRSVTDRFGVSKATLWSSFSKVVEALSGLSSSYITMPDLDQCGVLASEFFRKADFPGVIGCIDGCHIPIKAPKCNPESYINGKGFHSVILQGVVDHRCCFTDCYVGEVGSVRDKRVFRRSKLSKEINQYKPYHILGDSAYPLLPCLMTPFKDDGQMTEAMTKYNIVHSETHSTVDRAFALLRGRFRRLKYLDMSRTDMIPAVIMACCVLHNICLSQGDDWDDLLEQEEDDKNVYIPSDVNDNCNSQASKKRLEIAANL